ncbi:MAG: hypothetical protein JWQ84_1585, partial [Mucilaginibacter sp.]|nr:hypothetical protein [Mucilaginibacter sp.]
MYLSSSRKIEDRIKNSRTKSQDGRRKTEDGRR